MKLFYFFKKIFTASVLFFTVAIVLQLAHVSVGFLHGKFFYLIAALLLFVQSVLALYIIWTSDKKGITYKILWTVFFSSFQIVASFFFLLTAKDELFPTDEKNYSATS